MRAIGENERAFTRLKNFPGAFLSAGAVGRFRDHAVLGGMRSFWGPLIDAGIFVVLEDYISGQTANWMSFINLFFVPVVPLSPRGVLGVILRKPIS